MIKKDNTTKETLYQPVTGAINCNSIEPEILSDLLYDGIDLDFEAYCNEPINEDPEGEFYEAQDPEILIGFKKNSDGIYDIDPNEEISIIYSGYFNTLQIVKSKWIKDNCVYCSPCFPGQADLDSNSGQLVGYCVPENWLDKSGVYFVNRKNQFNKVR